MSASANGVVSLADLMRHHRELLVHPLLWTSRHLEMTGFRFQHINDENASSHVVPLSSEEIWEEKSDAQSLAASFSIQGKLKALANILLSTGSILDKRRNGNGADFFFSGQSVHQPQSTVFYCSNERNQPASQQPQPVIGYLNYTNVSGPCWHRFPFPQRRPGGCDNAPVRRLCKIKHARVTPKEWTEDPYFVCILLSLAQLQQRRLKPLIASSETNHLVRLVENPFDRGLFHIYEARITSAFVEALDNPMTATVKTNPVTIEHRQLPYRPFKTFQQRILAELILDDVLHRASDLTNGTSTCSDVINEHLKRPHEHEDDGGCKRGRIS